MIRIPRRLAPYLMTAPFVMLFATFTLWPLLRSISLSFHKAAGPGQVAFVGLDNYRFLLHDALFWTAVGNTALYTVLFVGLQIPLALGLALALDSKRVRARPLLRYAFFCPHLVGSVFIGVVFWKLMGNDPTSLANRVVEALTPGDGDSLKWLGDPRLALFTVLAAALWLSVGYCMIYLLAALQSVDRQLHEAAEIDGASAWRRFCDVTLPGIRGTLIFLVLVSTIGAFQLFELPYVLQPNTGGAGPDNSTLTIVGYLYQTGFEMGNLGYASAVGWAMVVALAAIGFLQVRVTRMHRD